jgi:hypothetical protein
MTDEIIKKKKTVSYSQFSNWWTCPHKWYRDYILHEKTFEDNLIMTFGTSIHEAIQLYIKTLYEQGDKEAEAVDMMAQFMETFKREIEKKKIPHTKEEFDEFVEDAKNVISEFRAPENRLQHFPRDKWELIGIEDELNAEIRNNINLTGFIDLLLREKQSGNIRIIDIKTSNSGWNASQREDWLKISQLLLYKALYSKTHNIPLSKINIEFFILRRKLYENCRYEQSRIQIFKPSSSQSDVLEVIKKFGKFIDTCFTSEGTYKPDIKYPKNPGKDKKNCKYCPYLKNGKCDGKKERLE